MAAHIFAYFVKNLSLGQSSILRIIDVELLRRLVSVVRIKLSDKLIIFDTKKIYTVIVSRIEKSELLCSIQSIEDIIRSNKITFYLPRLEKDYLEESLYSCAIAGVEQIYIVDYQFSKKNWGSKEKDWQRAEAILVSACEQAKQYAVPFLNRNLIAFDQMLKMASRNLICAHNLGGSAFDVVEEENVVKNIALTCGPEAGFSDVEEELLDNHFVKKIKLGNSVLRSRDAVYYLNALFSI